ncbi:MAG: hypothetical protein IT454_22330 [Planctomycetes bacterium]|nr:hypothetical protein [Planctomycetota bacterium]
MCHSSCLVVSGVALASLLGSCAIAPYERATKPYSELAYPGFFDVGIGATYLNRATSRSDDEAGGLALSLKAYPLGRWYSTKRDSTPALIESGVEALKGAKADINSASGTGSSDEKEKALAKTADETTAKLDSILTGIAAYKPNELFVVREREGLENRLSVTYGINVAEFEGGDFSKDVQLIGLGFDVTPEFAIVAGVAFYRDEVQHDVDTAYYYGISINVYAFKNLLTAASQ